MFSEESFTMERTDNIMPGKAAGMLKVCNSKWSAKLEIGSEINGMVFSVIKCKMRHLSRDNQLPKHRTGNQSIQFEIQTSYRKRPGNCWRSPDDHKPPIPSCYKKFEPIQGHVRLVKDGSRSPETLQYLCPWKYSKLNWIVLCYLGSQPCFEQKVGLGNSMGSLLT